MCLIARDFIGSEPVRNARELCLTIAIVTSETRVDMIGTIRLVESRCKNVVYSQPPRDCIDIMMKGCRGEKQAVSCGAVGRDLLERRSVQTTCDDLVGIAFGERRNLAAAKAFADEKAQIDRLQPRPVDQAQRIARPRQPDERQQKQPPLLPAPCNMHQETAVSS